MKKLIRLAALLLATLLLAGCSSNNYRYAKNGGNAYISLNYSHSEQEPVYNSVSMVVPSVTFSTIEEMRNDIKNGIFTKEELKQIAQFPRNEKGEIKAPNVDTLALSLPDSVELDRIVWSGDIPSFCFVRKDGAGEGFVYYKSQESLREELEHEYLNRTWASNQTVEAIPEANGKIAGTAYYFSSEFGGNWKDIQYEITANGITYYVQEQYQLARSDEQPILIKIWGVGSETTFMVRFTDVDNNLSKLTVDEITAFRLTS